MDKLTQLLEKCKCGVYIHVNEHRDIYESVLNYISEDEKEQIEPAIFEEMVKRDTIICIVFYPNTPISSFCVYHYDMNKALDTALNLLE